MKTPHKDIIEDLTKQVIKFRNARDWKQFHSPKDISISMAIEAGEVMDHFLWKNEDEIKKHVSKNKPAIAEELSDVLYCILLMSHDLDINVIDAFKQKMMKNEKNHPLSKAKGSIETYTKRHKE